MTIAIDGFKIPTTIPPFITQNLGIIAIIVILVLVGLKILASNPKLIQQLKI